MATDSKAMDMEVDTMDNMTTLITAMGVAKITVSDKCPQGTKTNARSFIFMVLLVVQKISVPFFFLSSRPGQYKLWENSKTWRPPE